MSFNPIKDVLPLCPCRITLRDNTQYRCDVPSGFQISPTTSTYTALSGNNPMSVPFREIVSFESIADKTRRIDTGIKLIADISNDIPLPAPDNPATGHPITPDTRKP